MCNEEQNNHRILKEEFEKSITHRRPEPSDSAPTERQHSQTQDDQDTVDQQQDSSPNN